MVSVLTEEIKDNILAKNPATFVKGYNLARIYQDGKVVIYTSGEGEYTGLKDTSFNYFYIRLKEETTTTEPADRTTSCLELELETSLRLVAWVNNANETKLQEVLVHDIITSDVYSGLSAANQRRVSKVYPITISEIIGDPERIFKEETLKENKDVKLKKNVRLLAIDFTLRFNYKPYTHPDECLDRNICEPCN